MSKKKPTKTKLIYENSSLTDLLFEQEDIFAEETEEEEPAEEGGEEEPAEEGDEGEGEEGAEEEGEGEEEEEELEVDVDEKVKLSKSIDQDLEALLIDFEAQARKSKGIETTEEEGIVIEHLHLGMLLEQDEDAGTAYEQEIDLDRFASEVARLIKNYTTLLDMEKMLLNKAREFVATRYGEEAEKELISQLETKHDIEIVEPDATIESDLEVPIAAGAGTPAGGA
tara:strand:+ start:4868 stop:5545 length:678 start_codon:yes stop_codon:yes gene_type:complete